MGLFIVKNVASCIVNLLIFKMLPILRGAVIGLTRSQLNSHPAEEDKPLKTSYLNIFMLVLFSHLVVSDSLQVHGLQHNRIPSPSLSPRV